MESATIESATIRQDDAASSGNSDIENDERRPLLGGSSSAQATGCTRFLLWLSYRQMFYILFGLFLLQLVENDQLNQWSKTLVTSLVADFLYSFICVLGLANAVISICSTAPDEPCGWLGALFWLLVSATLSWYSLVRISDVHRLEVRCMAPGHCPPSDDGSIWGFCLSWTLLPVGALHCLGGLVWRPAYLLGYLVSFGHLDMDPIREAYQWREITMGLTTWVYSWFWWSCMRTLPREEVSQPVLVAFFGFGGVMVLGVVFFLTTEPMQWMYLFLAHPWRELWRGVSQGKKLHISMQELASMCVVVWWLLRALLIFHIGNLQKWDARKKVEEALRFAMAHPYRAELVENFASRNVLADDSETPRHPLVQKFTRVLTGQPLAKLRTKRQKLADTRRSLLRDEAGGSAALPQVLVFTVRRQELLEDTWKALVDRPVAELLAHDVMINFEGESGIDAGGVQRDWFDTVARLLTEGSGDVSGTSLLTTAPDQTLMPRAVGSEEQHQQLFALGMFIALAVFREQPLPLAFSQVACKYFLQVPIGPEDVRQLDPEFYRGRVLQVLKTGGLQEMEDAISGNLFFVSAPTELRPQEQEDLKPGGSEMPVTEDNKLEYVQLLSEAHLCGGIRHELQLLLSGFWHILPLELLQRYQVTPPELSVMISGIMLLDVAEWRAQTEYEPDESHSEVYEWFWKVVKELDAEKRCMLLQFVTGSSRLPPGGFADLRPKFRVTTDNSAESAGKLPESHTCLNQIILYKYPTYESTREKLITAISAEGFGLA